jgi:hypothetical protein
LVPNPFPALKNANKLFWTNICLQTGNQVLFIKGKTTDNPETPENEASYTVGFESAVGVDVQFNWWMVN